MKINLDWIPDYSDVEAFGAEWSEQSGSERELAAFYAAKGCTRLAKGFYQRSARG